jgi:hypothetical protein
MSHGRVIWRREGGPTGVDGVRTGLLEQHLTPEGIELLRSEIISTGLFDVSQWLDTTRLSTADLETLIEIVERCGHAQTGDSEAALARVGA